MIEGAIVVLIIVAAGAVVVVNVVFTIREWRRLKRLPPSPSPRPRSTGIGNAVEGFVGCLGGLAGGLFYLVVGLGGPFVIVWLVKRMWEAA
jgi:hypothetical protein